MRPFWKKPEEPPPPIVVSAEDKVRAKQRHWMRTTWSSDGFQLWLANDDGSLYLCFLQIKQLSLCHEDESVGHWVCGYCGVPDQAGSICSACNGPRRGRRQKAALTLVGPLPHALVLNGASSPFVLETHYVECGRLDIYTPERLVARMHDCEIVSQQVTGFGDSGKHHRECHQLSMEYIIKCQLAFTAEEMMNLDYYRS